MHRPTPASLILGAVILLSIPSMARAQFIPCNIVNLSVNHPFSVPAGQTLNVITSVTGSCEASNLYVLRVDLVDQRSGTVLSSVRVPYYPWNPSSVIINNTATAPSSIGPWVLQIQAYMINGMSGQVGASSQEQFVVDITQFAPQAIMTTAALSAGNTIQLFQASMSSFATQTLQSSTSSALSMMSTFATNPAASQPSDSLIEALVLILLVGAAAFFIIMWRRRPPSPTPA